MRRAVLFLSLVSLASCAATHPVSDYAAFYESQPESILVVPVANETTSSEAPLAFMSTIATPLLQRGYYVFPVLPTVEIMKVEGIYEGEQLQDVPPRRFKELLGADAVLFVTIHSWDTVYLVLASGVSVSMTYRLVDTSTGQTLWLDQETRSISSDSGGGDLISAAISAALTALTIEYIELAREANGLALASLPAAPGHPDFEREREKYMKIAEEQARRRAKESEATAVESEQ